MSKHTPTLERAHPLGMGGFQKLYRFENGYGASLVQFPGSYGLEMAVLKFTGEDTEDFHLCYDTPITDDVIGHMHDAQIEDTLDAIKALPALEDATGAAA